jgi:hypothetical protein
MVKKTRSHPDTKNNSDKIDILIAIAGNTIVEVGGKINAQDA